MHGYVYLAHATPVDCELVQVKIWPIVGCPGSCGVSAVNIQTLLSNSKSVSEQACSKSLKHGNSILSSGGSATTTQTVGACGRSGWDGLFRRTPKFRIRCRSHFFRSRALIWKPRFARWHRLRGDGKKPSRGRAWRGVERVLWPGWLPP